MTTKGSLIRIGRKELVSLPELYIQDIEARIDTGAYTSSLHCQDIMLKQVDGKEVLAFKVLDQLESDHATLEVVFTNFSETVVKSSNGISEKRYKIVTPVVLGDQEVMTELTLTDRSEMKYPVLIGRKTLRNRFVVDVAAVYLLNKDRP